jgi:hypothetical protein
MADIAMAMLSGRKMLRSNKWGQLAQISNAAKPA